MITPLFNLDQDELFVYINIRAPMAKLTETEIAADGCEFRFYSRPYFLRLTLPGEVIENGEENATYDADTNSFRVRVSKVNQGEHFEGLDMLTKLLQPAGNKSASSPKIEVIGGTSTATEGEENEEEFDWSVEQTLWTEEDERALAGEPYGFANTKSGIFARLQEDLQEVVDIRDPDSKPLKRRREERLAAEDERFSDDHYLADLYEADDNAELQQILAFQPWEGLDDDPSCLELTDDDRLRMLRLPNKEYLLDKSAKKMALLGIIDILYSYCYDVRTTLNEPTCESGWTIAKLSATLSWFDCYSSIDDVIISCIRRSLIYPLYRRWDLCLNCLEDVKRILSCGRSAILKCFLKIQQLFAESGDSRYLLNDLYITDYCIWIQTVKESTFAKMANHINPKSVTKSMIGLDLDVLEQAAQLAIEEEKEEHQLDNDRTIPERSINGNPSLAGATTSAVTAPLQRPDSDDDDDATLEGVSPSDPLSTDCPNIKNLVIDSDDDEPNSTH